MRRAFLSLLPVCLLVLALGSQALAGPRVALVIGVSDYQGMSKLTNPVTDAKAVAAALKSHGFEVVERYDLARAELLDALEEFSSLADQAQVALVYYAGHGMEMAGRNVLAPKDMEIDCEKKTPRRAIELDQVFAAVSGAPQQIVLLDACRNDPFPQCPNRSAGSGSGFRGFSRVNAEGHSLLIANATLSGQLAADGSPGQHSPFAAALLARFDSDPKAYLRDLLDLTASDVSKASRGGQIPEILTRGGAPLICLDEDGCGERASPRPELANTAPQALLQTSNLDRAARGWADVQSTESKAVLEAYLREFPEGFYAELARSRLASLTQGEEQRNPAPTPPSDEPESSVPFPPSDEPQSVAGSGTDFTLLRTMDAQSSLILTLAFSPDGSVIATGGAGNVIQLWDAANGTLLRKLEGHSGWVKSLAFSPDGKVLASASEDKTAKLWDVAGGGLLRTFTGAADKVTSVAFSPDGKILAIGSDDQKIRLVDPATGKIKRSITEELYVKTLSYSADGKTIGAGGSNLGIWDVASGKLLKRIHAEHFVMSVALSPTGDGIAGVIYTDPVVRLWDTENGELKQSFEGHSAAANVVAFSPDGRLLATGADDHTVKVFEVVTGKLKATLGAGDEVDALAFSPDGTLLAAASEDSKINVWSVPGGTSVSR